MDLPLDIVGTAARAPLFAEADRPLAEADLVLLGTERGTKAPPLKRLRERHHALARHIASGMQYKDAAAICGYELSRVSILLADPSFKELVEFYSADVKRRYAAMHDVLAGLSLDAALLIRERLEEHGEEIPITTLNELVKMGADRTGTGPSSKQEVNVNVNLASRLEEARKRVASRTIDLQPIKDAAE